jgi:hypothetical protein
MLGLAIYFNFRQNKVNHVGGQISWPKSFWLIYTIVSWFFIPITFLYLPLPQDYRVFFIFHLVSFWSRGLIELVMIYRFFNWSPRYGIAHDLFHLTGLLFLLPKSIPLVQLDSLLLFSFIFMLILIVGVFFETIFAYWFLKIRGEKEHKIYFAANTKEWRKVNQVTFLADVLCYGGHLVLAYLALQWQ